MTNSKLYFFFAILLFISCQEQGDEQMSSENHLGVLEHEFNISEAAKPDFEKGLLLIHSFEYDDALTAFQSAKDKDSTEIMAYWGEAMSHYKALWGLQDKRAGYAVLEQIGASKGERMAAISDPLEKEFWEGVEILYGDGSLNDRNKSFNMHMGSLHVKYPKNQEVAAFYGLSLMWENGEDTDNEIIGKKAAAIAESILEENPLHPGALHYTIHAYDDPDIAELAIDAANKYSKVAPDAGHALHMPSHIYLALGMWSEVVQSNEVSYAASVNRMARLGLTDEARGYHAYAWLHYAYLQQNRVNDAAKLLHDIGQYYENTQSKGIRSYIASMQAAQLFETGEWPKDLKVLEVKKSDLGLGTQMRSALFEAQLALMSKDVSGISESISELEKEIKKAKLYVSEDKASMCSAGPSRYAPNEDAIFKAEAVLNQIYAIQAVANKNNDVEKYLSAAVELEMSSEYAFGPADISIPSFEMYGHWLNENDRYDEALKMFDLSLERAPNRRNALIGKRKSLQELGLKDKVGEVDAILEGFIKEKDLASI